LCLVELLLLLSSAPVVIRFGARNRLFQLCRTVLYRNRRAIQLLFLPPICVG
jgi:hypothetical protein